MKIKLLIGRVGPAGTFNRGDEIDVPDAEARRMIDRGQAVPVRSAKKEKAVRSTPVEKAAK